MSPNEKGVWMLAGLATFGIASIIGIFFLILSMIV